MGIQRRAASSINATELNTAPLYERVVLWILGNSNYSFRGSVSRQYRCSTTVH